MMQGETRAQQGRCKAMQPRMKKSQDLKAFSFLLDARRCKGCKAISHFL
jgi:hypothetical protein